MRAGSSPATASPIWRRIVHSARLASLVVVVISPQPLTPASGNALVSPVLPDGCKLAGPVKEERAQLALLGRASVSCAGPVASGGIGWPSLAGKADAIVRIVPLGRQPQVYRLTAAYPVATIAERPSAAQVWRSYFGFGVVHILEGWDHLLFVIALVLQIDGGVLDDLLNFLRCQAGIEGQHQGNNPGYVRTG